MAEAKCINDLHGKLDLREWKASINIMDVWIEKGRYVSIYKNIYIIRIEYKNNKHFPKLRI